jgi:spermidine synthase
MKDFKVSVEAVAQWMNAIRDLPTHEERTRALDALWDGQLDSKAWLVDHVSDCCMGPNHIYIFGGWIGLLAGMIAQHEDIDVKSITSIDIDPWCQPLVQRANERYPNVKAVVADMMTYEYDERPDIVINTSTEHVTQEVYDAWYNRIPKGTLVVAQGNNFFDCPEHVRCSRSLVEFMAMNRCDIRPYFTGKLETSMYTRYMAIWRKDCF